MELFSMLTILSICFFLPNDGQHHEGEAEVSPPRDKIGSEKGMCNWLDAATASSGTVTNIKAFKAYGPNPQITVVGNSDTGVNALAASIPLSSLNVGTDVTPEAFAAVIHMPGEIASMAVQGLVVPQNVELNFKMYEACADHVLEVCFGPTNCQKVSNPDVSISDRQWRSARVIVPAGTTEIVIKATDSGKYHCSTGVRDFTVEDPVTGADYCCAGNTVTVPATTAPTTTATAPPVIPVTTTAPPVNPVTTTVPPVNPTATPPPVNPPTLFPPVLGPPGFAEFFEWLKANFGISVFG